MIKNEAWLNVIHQFPSKVISYLIEKSPTADSKARGRPLKDFASSSEKTQKRRVSQLVEERSSAELALATRMKMRSENMHGSTESFSRPSKACRKIFSSECPTATGYTAEEALSLLIRTDMTKEAYQEIRNSAKAKGADIYPAYNKLREEKKLCYPENVTIREMSAVVPLQDLVNHTAARLLLALDNPFQKSQELTLICKYGMDGATGQSLYKQPFANEGITMQEEKSFFCACLVPIELRAGQEIEWRNPTPSSLRFCRPINIQYAKETKELVKALSSELKQEINETSPFFPSLYSQTSQFEDYHKVSFDFHLTMIDGKIEHILTDTGSTQVCTLCGAKPSQMNNIDLVKSLKVKKDFLQFDLSPLHSRIRVFECILHISYRIEIKKWQIRSDEDKGKLKHRKKLVQENLRKSLNIIADVPRIGGSGTSNDGNSSRIAFRNYKTFSEATDVDVGLVRSLSTILELLSSSDRQINSEAFHQYCTSTAKLFVDLYPWFYMPSSLHKILVHSHQIVTHFSIPIGSLSEEALETRNKCNKAYRLHHSRKDSRLHTMEDQFHRLLMTSDPKISLISLKTSRHKKKILAPEIDEEMKKLCFPHTGEDNEADDEE